VNRTEGIDREIAATAVPSLARRARPTAVTPASVREQQLSARGEVCREDHALAVPDPQRRWALDRPDEPDVAADAHDAVGGLVLPTGHWPMSSRPAELADIIAQAATPST
jgi:hypothetical protein